MPPSASSAARSDASSAESPTIRWTWARSPARSTQRCVTRVAPSEMSIEASPVDVTPIARSMKPSSSVE